MRHWRSLRFASFFLLLISVIAFSAVEFRDGKVAFTFRTDVTARVVYLAGDFNGWNPTAWAMRLVDGVWRYEVELKPGSYQYKYVIDGRSWKEDPEAPGFVDDGYGGKNGAFILTIDGKILPPEGVAKPSTVGKVYEPNTKRADTIFIDPDGYVVIRFYSKDAKSIFIAGNFNNWNDKATEVYFIEDGWWEAILELQPGVYEYKFVVDGRWVTDPNAFAFVDDGFGGKNGVFEVYREGGKLRVGAPRAGIVGGKAEITEKVEAIKPGVSVVGGKVLFAVKNDRAQEAYLAGTFNNWNPTALRMQLVDGLWVASLQLAPGTYEYKYVFIVGGNQVWQEDPNAPSYKPDGFGGKNGVFKLVSRDGTLSIEGVEEAATGLPVKGKYEFEYKFKLHPTKYLVGDSVNASLWLTYEPAKDSYIKIRYSGANLSEALLKFTSDPLTLGLHFGTSWELPVEGQDRGIVFSYKLGEFDLVAGAGYDPNSLPWIVGVRTNFLELYVGSQYFTNTYDLLVSAGLRAPLVLKTTLRYSFDNSFYVVGELATEQLGIKAWIAGVEFGAFAYFGIGDGIFSFEGTYDAWFNDINVSLNYELTKEFAVSLGAKFSQSNLQLSSGVTKFLGRGRVGLEVDVGNVTAPLNSTTIKLTGGVDF